MKYKATRDSHGFQGRFWSKGETVEVADGGEVPPKEHFEPEGGQPAGESPEGQAPEPSDKSQDTEKEPEPEPEATPEPEPEPEETEPVKAQPKPTPRAAKPSQGATHRRVTRRR